MLPAWLDEARARTAGIDPGDTAEGRAVAADQCGGTRPSDAKDGGGGGSRTRVRKYVFEGIYMRIRFWFLMAGVRKRLKTVGHQTR